VALLSNYNTRPINTELYFTASSLDVRLQPLQNVVELKYSFSGLDFYSLFTTVDRSWKVTLRLCSMCVANTCTHFLWEQFRVAFSCKKDASCCAYSYTGAAST